MDSDHPGRGPRIIGRYALHDEIAAGGMATVHVGRLLGPVGFSRTVAIKRLHPQFAKDPEFVSMFLDEARLAARIQHPNVVPTLDVVALDGELFLVMEYIQGESLSRIHRRLHAKDDGVPPRIAVAILAGVLQGLHAAHEARNERGDLLEIVHRDVSPQNVLLGVDGVPRVADFGVAKATGRSHHTADGHIKGKVGYMAPEQLSGRAIDRRTDIYAASVVLWELLARRRLFKAENAVAAWAQICERVIEPPSAFGPGVPTELDAVVLRGLRREPEGRYPTAMEMAEELEKALAPASGRELAGWVKAAAAEVLHARAVRVAEIESASTSSSLLIPTPRVSTLPVDLDGATSPGSTLEPPGTVTHASNLSVSATREKRTAGVWMAGAIVLGLATGVGAITVRRWVLRPAPAPAATAAGIAPLPPAPEPPVVGPDDSPPPPPPAAAASSVPAVPASAPARAAPVDAVHGPSRRPRAPSDARKSCNPPYTVDSSGVHIPKPECL